MSVLAEYFFAVRGVNRHGYATIRKKIRNLQSGFPLFLNIEICKDGNAVDFGVLWIHGSTSLCVIFEKNAADRNKVIRRFVR